MSLAIVWFRRDLRLYDNPALAAALANHKRILPLYIHAPDEDAPWQPGAATHWWLHHALADLAEQLNGRLLIRRGDSLATLQDLAGRTGASAVYWNRLYEPAAVRRDTGIKTALHAAGIGAVSENAALLFEPWEAQNRQGGPYRVFTPFWKRLLEFGLPQSPVDVPAVDGRVWKSAAGKGIDGCSLDDLGLLPEVPWDQGIATAWHPSRAGAEARLEEFIATELRHYAHGRDMPGREQVSRLSPYLHFGQLGPREIVHACRNVRHAAADFLREIGWREFAHHLLYHFPHTSDAPMDERFSAFPWREDGAALRAWQRGETGIPLVDAGMRQLWATGWMHNRVRMIVASFLTKNLLLSWQAGARWFWDTLVDADLAGNSLGWQWTAGCGADAAPYFRVFNPVLQGEKFDPAGDYVARWVPELSRLPAKWIHRPWESPESVLRQAGIVQGSDYPHPLVDLKASRLRALEAWGRVK
ncbi:MAG: deoxyribodipyrimidine photo-lyase [Sedimenticolaceae bacterium]